MVWINLRINSDISDFSGTLGRRVIRGGGGSGAGGTILNILDSNGDISPEVALLYTLILYSLYIIEATGVFSAN